VRSLGGRLEQSSAFQCFAPERSDASPEFRGELPSPSGKLIRPRLDRVFVNRTVVKRADTSPPVVIDERHGRFPPLSLPDNAPLQDCCNHVMPVFKDVRFDDEIFADDAFYQVATAVEQRLQIFYNRRRKGPKHRP